MPSSKWSSFVEQLKHNTPQGERGGDGSSQSKKASEENPGEVPDEQSDEQKVVRADDGGGVREKAESKTQERESEPAARRSESPETGQPQSASNPSKPSVEIPRSPTHTQAKSGVGGFLANALGGGARDEIALAIGGDRIYLASRNHPEVVAYETVMALARSSGDIVALGKEAEVMRGQEPSSIVTEQILEHGMAVDPGRFAEFFKTLLRQHFRSRRYQRPRVVCAGNFPTPLAKRATIDAILDAGAREVLLCDPEIAAGVGLGVDVLQPELNSILLIEKDWVGSVVVSMGNVMTQMNSYSGIDALLEYISIELHENQGFAPRLKSLEEAIFENGFEGTLHLEGWEAWGDQLEKGRPKSLKFAAEKCKEAAKHYFLLLKHQVNRSLEPLDMDRRWTVENSPVYLAGPCSDIPGFAELVAKALNREVECSAKGSWALGHGLVDLLSNNDYLTRLKAGV